MKFTFPHQVIDNIERELKGPKYCEEDNIFHYKYATGDFILYENNILTVLCKNGKEEYFCRFYRPEMKEKFLELSKDYCKNLKFDKDMKELLK